MTLSPTLRRLHDALPSTRPAGVRELLHRAWREHGIDAPPTTTVRVLVGELRRHGIRVWGGRGENGYRLMGERV